MGGFIGRVLLDEDEKSFGAERSTRLDYPFEFFPQRGSRRSIVFVEKNNDSARSFLRPPREGIEGVQSGRVSVEVAGAFPRFRFLFVQGIAE